MNDKEILRLVESIGLTREEHSVAVFETAIEYLELKAGIWASDISKTKSFWLWWKHQWHIVDEVFYASHKTLFGSVDKTMLKDIWLDDHKSYRNMRSIDGKIWDEFYFNMIHQVNKEVTELTYQK